MIFKDKIQESTLDIHEIGFTELRLLSIKLHFKPINLSLRFSSTTVKIFLIGTS